MPRAVTRIAAFKGGKPVAFYPSITIAARTVGVSRQAISLALKTGKPIAGYHWAYAQRSRP